MYTFATTNSKHKQVPIAYGETSYLTHAAEPAETTATGRVRLSPYNYAITRRSMLRRIRRELRTQG